MKKAAPIDPQNSKLESSYSILKAYEPMEMIKKNCGPETFIMSIGFV